MPSVKSCFRICSSLTAPPTRDRSSGAAQPMSTRHTPTSPTAQRTINGGGDGLLHVGDDASRAAVARRVIAAILAQKGLVVLGHLPPSPPNTQARSRVRTPPGA